MNPILGNGIALAAVAALAWSCIRFLWRDTRRGGGCAGCGGCASCHGGCSGCHSGEVDRCGGGVSG